MKNLLKTAAVATILSFGAMNANAIVLNFAATGNSQIVFDGAGNFSFVDDTVSTYDFSIVGTDGLDTAVGYRGNLQGSFAIGTISGSSAPVTGVGSLSIDDGVNVLTATVEWVDIMQSGTIGGLNTVGSVNLSNIAYGGTDPDLLALLSPGGTGVATVTFQFTTAMTLNALKNDGAETSYSGSITAPVGVPDGGSSVLLLGAALIAASALRKRFTA